MQAYYAHTCRVARGTAAGTSHCALAVRSPPQHALIVGTGGRTCCLGPSTSMNHREDGEPSIHTRQKVVCRVSTGYVCRYSTATDLRDPSQRIPARWACLNRSHPTTPGHVRASHPLPRLPHAVSEAEAVRERVRGRPAPLTAPIGLVWGGGTGPPEMPIRANVCRRS